MFSHLTLGTENLPRALNANNRDQVRRAWRFALDHGGADEGRACTLAITAATTALIFAIPDGNQRGVVCHLTVG